MKGMSFNMSLWIKNANNFVRNYLLDTSGKYIHTDDFLIKEAISGFTIGRYQTHERAKEVLREMEEALINSQQPFLTIFQMPER